MMLSIISVLIMLITTFFVPVAAGIYVYRDARRRQMNAVLWTVVAILVPGLIGFVIYLLVRGNYSDLRCPNCQTPVQKNFAICPNCGTRLRPSCPNCAASVELEWKVCPFCTQPLPEQPDVTPPVHGQDRSVGKIIAVVMIVPLALMILFLFGAMTFSGGSGSCGMVEVTREEYFSNQSSEEARLYVQEWLADLDKNGDQNRAYALQYSKPQNEDRTQYDFLVYVPGTGGRGSGIGMSSSLFGTTLNMNLETTGNSGTLYNLTTIFEGDRLKLKVILDEKKIPCSVTEVDFAPSLMYVEQNALTSEEVLLPEQITVVKLVKEETDQLEGTAPEEIIAGSTRVRDQDTIEKIFRTVDNAPYLDPDDPVYKAAGNDRMEVYDIILSYESYEDREEVLAWMWDGNCYLEDTAHNDDGRYLRKADSGFYDLLAELENS